MYASPHGTAVRPARAPRACPLLPSLLATALWAALPVHAADLTGPLEVSAGNSLQLGADDVLTHGAGGFALTVTGAGSSALVDGSRINVTGNGSAVSAANGGQVQLRGATLSIAPATGVGVYALYANGAGSVIDARDVDIDATRNASGFGVVQAYNGGVVHYTGGRIAMTGGVGTLVGASGKGSEAHLDNLQMSADSGARLRADSAGLLTIRNSRITLAPAASSPASPSMAWAAAPSCTTPTCRTVGSISTAVAACCWRTSKRTRWAAACACSAAASTRPIPAR